MTTTQAQHTEEGKMLYVEELRPNIYGIDQRFTILKTDDFTKAHNAMVNSKAPRVEIWSSVSCDMIAVKITGETN